MRLWIGCLVCVGGKLANLGAEMMIIEQLADRVIKRPPEWFEDKKKKIVPYVCNLNLDIVTTTLREGHTRAIGGDNRLYKHYRKVEVPME